MIEINNLTSSRVEKRSLIKVAQKVLEKEGKEKRDLSIVLVGPKKMRELNSKYRQKNWATDVLSFSGLETPKRLKGEQALNSELGELVICLKEVRKNAKRFGSTFERELLLALIHGILHLFGYDHEKSKQAARQMKEKESYYLRG